MTPLQEAGALNELATFYDTHSAELGVSTSEQFVPPIATRELRRRRRTEPDGTAVMTLVDRDGVLRWEAGAMRRASSRRRRRRGIFSKLIGTDKPVTELRFEQLAPNEITAAIRKLDDKLAARFPEGPYGLRRFEDGVLKPTQAPKTTARGKRVLLLVHGTFSNCDHMLMTEMLAAGRNPAEGDAARALLKKFDEVLTFDHPTLSVSPMLNAYELALRMRGVQADVTVVGHSRGGLVTRWWLEAFGGALEGPRKAVMVGSPLAGTSLASPARLREALDLLTNIGNALRRVGEVATPFAPFLEVPVVLLKVFTSVTSVLGSTPIADAAIALVPGLNGMSRAGNNAELLQLRAAQPGKAKYFAIQSNFEPEDVRWKFWKAFRPTNIADRAVDFLFPGTNDLVVDCASMIDMFKDSSHAPQVLHDFGTSALVHHVNYFRSKDTIDGIARLL